MIHSIQAWRSLPDLLRVSQTKRNVNIVGYYIDNKEGFDAYPEDITYGRTVRVEHSGVVYYFSKDTRGRVVVYGGKRK